MKRIILAAPLIATILLSFVALASPAFAKNRDNNNIEKLAAEEIKTANMIQYVQALCNGTMGPVGERLWNPRTQGTPYGDASNNYIYGKFIEWGLDRVEIFENPEASDTYYLKTWNVSIQGFTFHACWPCKWSPAGESEGQLTYVGMGMADEDYLGKNVTGKIVVADGPAPLVYMIAVEKYGAIGVLSDFPNAEGQFTTWAGLSRIPTGSLHPGMTVSYVDGQNLKALLYNSTVTIHIDIDSEILHGTSKSVIATIEGSTSSNRYMLVTAHADSDSGGPGADDNASGVAALMEMARALMKLINAGRIPRPNFSIKFMAVGSEIYDSYAYIEAHENELNKIVTVLNFDEVGYGGWADMLYFEGNDLPFLQPLMNKLNSVGKEYFNTYWNNYTTSPSMGGSDHEPYLEFKVPATTIFTDAWWIPDVASQPQKWGGGEIMLDGCPYYHSNMDTPENTVLLEPFNMAWAARSGIIALIRLANFRT